MIQETIVVGQFMCNCTILACEETKEAIVIDPGDEPKKILDVIKQLGVNVKSIIHTHAHLDHITGTRLVKEETEAPIAIHKDDLFLYENLVSQASNFGFDTKQPLKIDKFLKDGDTIQFGKCSLRVLHTPGHTPGSVCFRTADAKSERHRVFSGDTLFAHSIGRTDLWGGDPEQILVSIKEQLLTLDDDTLVYPGHGPKTKIGEERRKNYFLQRLT